MDHPNILKLYEVFEDSKGYYLVTELCTGGELFEYITEKRKFSEATAAHFMKQILGAIAYCHRQGIVHRDMKPENLLLESHEEQANLKVIDFGTSALISPNQKLDQKLGTPYYTAPEIIKGHYNHKVDVWSSGVILYIMLCGYPPFNGHSDKEILQKAAKAEVNFPKGEWKSVSSLAKDLIRRMLTKDPERRPEAFDVLDDPWVKKFAPKYGEMSEHNLATLEKLQTFRSETKMQQAVMTFIASQLIRTEDTKELKETFQMLDLNNDGQLSREELLQGYTKILGSVKAAEEEVERIMQ
jgi:calcium-dependent protein kinase